MVDSEQWGKEVKGWVRLKYEWLVEGENHRGERKTQCSAYREPSPSLIIPLSSP